MYVQNLLSAYAKKKEKQIRCTPSSLINTFVFCSKDSIIYQFLNPKSEASCPFSCVGWYGLFVSDLIKKTGFLFNQLKSNLTCNNLSPFVQ